jgi:thiosulfate/3-mercaptopyruvate sulfurtransferase
MSYSETIISTDELAQHLADPGWAVIDCRFSLQDVGRGRADYLAAHITGAVYAHLDENLSGPVVRGVTGRHPLPTVDRAVEVFSGWGIGPETQVVAYDDAGGALAAVRVWWMLRWLGHQAAAVLDGGWQKWQREGRPVRSGSEARQPAAFHPERLRTELVVSTADVNALRQDRCYLVGDARAAERYRGLNETIDPVAGHIPGAVSTPYVRNLAADGTFQSPAVLRTIYQELLGDVPAENAVFYCGSGVTSIHNILALQIAGLGEARLYAGSWSEWITDPARPVATGEGD